MAPTPASMEVTQLPRRRAAIKATTNFAESSSEDEKDHGKDTDDYHATPRATGSKPKRDKGNKAHERKRSQPEAKDLDPLLAATSAKKRKRTTAGSAEAQRKRQRASAQKGSDILGSSFDDESDLTPLSSDSEDEEAPKSFTRPLDLFPFPTQLSPLATKPIPKRTQHNRSRPIVTEALSLDDEDSDDLPDVGAVLSQQTIALKKGKKPQRKYQPKSRRKQPQDVIPHSFTSSQTLPPTISPSSATRTNYLDDNATTETNLSDNLNLSDDSDLDFDTVEVNDGCFAKGKSADTAYWPARILEIKRPPPGKGKRKKMYRVMFLDKSERDIPRDRFFCSYTARILLMYYVVNDFDEENQHNAATNDDHHPSPQSRSPSPVDLSDPPILSGPDFCDLPLCHQMSYVIPILKAILTERAAWALRRHKMYMKGGATRQKLKDEGGLRGAVDAKTADDFLPLVEKWCLGIRGPYFVGDHEETGAEEQLQHQHSPEDSEHEAGENPGVDDNAVAGSSSELVAPEAPREDEVPPPIPEAEVGLPLFSQLICAQIVFLKDLATETTEQAIHDLQLSEQAEHQPDSELAETVSDRNSPLPPPSTQQTAVAEFDNPLPKVKRPRQIGCPDYEKLLPLDKVQYCLDVLVPEGLNQLLLWRKGERKSVEVMWDNVEEEARLHERGEGLLNETDWVMDLMRMRNGVGASLYAKARLGKGLVEKVKKKDKTLRRTRSGRLGGAVGSYKE
ncbi:hypothetical protein NP233_g5068 [Leucocoprinus birnbaumii]|uniref:PWWP domain-containing protein n=1 Tax=Leucocoprinus birnbaumii TaxID=56174 RepID=A0AAD5YUY2_9AGAR|nr:hypothetical protein NP233_g5068 [Leucocoprinus birnbaumii]